ncbi:BON domain-containing protein [Arcobacter suis]|uniref:Periplasmic chaperone OsmY (BON domain) n=1 Tax=Arcobacter suis CECT 7833 TaxID=663365 RepID=A0AAD0SNR5_9BACT|nr:BON domain-containing protein [Arcobacter suis]AXX88883.1 putative periplasmic chaperone OsmY (BON domain) [Arcobacter suis CECT 7833]
MKQGKFLKAAIVATILIVNTVPLLATEVSDTTKSKSTIGEKIDDTVITTQVKMALMKDSSTATLGADVTTTNGVVLLQGTVQDNSERDMTTKVGASVQGVKSVQNEMKVITEQTSTVGERLEDTAITTKVKMALTLHASTGALRTTVTTTDSVVTVGGKAKNKAEKELVSKIVEDVKGVRKVINNMTVE